MIKVSREELVEVLTRPRKYEGYIQAVCPQEGCRDRDPSLLVFDDGTFRCLRCLWRGRHWELMAKLQKSPPARAVIYHSEKRHRVYHASLPTSLSALADLAEQAHMRLMEDESLLYYLVDRGVASMTVPARLGYWESYYTIPIFDAKHDFLGLMCRASPALERVTGERFYQPAGQKPMPYVPVWGTIRPDRECYVVFGIFDALALASLGLPVMTTIGGKDSFRAEWLDGIRAPIIIVPDLGEEQTAIALAGKLGWRGSVLKLDYPDGLKDPADILRRRGREALLRKLNLS